MNYLIHDVDRDGWGAASLLAKELSPEKCRLFPVREKNPLNVLKSISPTKGDTIWILDLPAPESWNGFPKYDGPRVVWVDHHLESWRCKSESGFEVILPLTDKPTTTMSMLVKFKLVKFDGAMKFVRAMCSRDGKSDWAQVFDGLSTMKRLPMALDELPSLLAHAPSNDPIPDRLKSAAEHARNHVTIVGQVLNDAVCEESDHMVLVRLDDAHGIPLRQYSLKVGALYPSKVVVLIHRQTTIYCGRDSSKKGIDFVRYFRSRGLEPKGHSYVAFVSVAAKQVEEEGDALKEALKQRSYLERTIVYASEIRQKLNLTLEKHGERVHFRPSTSGVSMIGLLHANPQRGSGTLTSIDDVEKNFEKLFKTHCKGKTQGRETGEKELQSFLIREAYKHDRRIQPLNDASQSTDSPVELIFVTDEIALPLKGSKTLCDILALRQDTKLGVIPVLLELKDSRQMKRLIEQVEGYSKLIDLHRDLFEDLYSALLGKRICFGGNTEKWIVWRSSGQHTEPKEREYARRKIRVACYQQEKDRFAFSVGKIP